MPKWKFFITPLYISDREFPTLLYTSETSSLKSLKKVPLACGAFQSSLVIVINAVIGLITAIKLIQNWKTSRSQEDDWTKFWGA